MQVESGKAPVSNDSFKPQNPIMDAINKTGADFGAPIIGDETVSDPDTLSALASCKGVSP